MKVLFYGTPEFALPTLEGVLERHQVVAVVTQPDRPAGRGQRVTASPVKRHAEAAGLPGLLAARLGHLGATLLLKTLESLATLTPTPQRHELATLAPRLKKEDGVLHWTEPVRALVNLIRGCNPWPGATAGTPRGRIFIWRATALDEPFTPHPPQ